jgi:hypothetical protein
MVERVNADGERINRSGGGGGGGCSSRESLVYKERTDTRKDMTRADLTRPDEKLET